MRYRFSPPWAEHKRVGFRGLTLKTQLTWRIIPVSKWVITMVTKSPTWSCSLLTIYLLTEVILKKYTKLLILKQFFVLDWGGKRFFFLLQIHLRWEVLWMCYDYLRMCYDYPDWESHQGRKRGKRCLVWCHDVKMPSPFMREHKVLSGNVFVWYIYSIYIIYTLSRI